MTDPPASYAFLPFISRGVSTHISRLDTDKTVTEPRPRLTVGVALNDGKSATVDLSVRGPGDVGGLDPRVIVRTRPANNSSDAESNYFPMCEFSEADLPWRYTPARPGNPDKLLPWLVLIVLKDDEVEAFISSTPDGTLPIVKVKVGAPLPKLDQSWAWAHVQVSGVQTIDTKSALDLLSSQPERLMSRLLCPRLLQPGGSYTGLLVPAFERGRLAGVGQDVPDSVDGLAPAWDDTGGPIELPVYYQWSFKVGVAGDFEELVRKLKPHPLPPTIGVRLFDASNPLDEDTKSGVEQAQSSILLVEPGEPRQLGLEGALKSPSTTAPKWADHDSFVNKLETLLNIPAQLLNGSRSGSVVAPPLYGAKHASRQTINDADGPPWYVELNQDPRLRVVAGAGTQVVQRNQQELMAAAWNQAGGVHETNQVLKFARFAKAIAGGVFEKHLSTMDPDSFLEVTSPIHSRVMASPITVAEAWHNSPIPSAMVESRFRSVSRSIVPTNRTTQIPSPEKTPTPRGLRSPMTKTSSSQPSTPKSIISDQRVMSRSVLSDVISKLESSKISPGKSGGLNLLEQLNQRTLTAAPPPTTPDGMLTLAKLGSGLVPKWASATMMRILRRFSFVLSMSGFSLLLLAAFLLFVGGPDTVAVVLAGLGLAALKGSRTIRNMTGSIERGSSFRNGTLTPQEIWSGPSKPKFVAVESYLTGQKQSTLPGGATRAGPDAPTTTNLSTFGEESTRK